MTSESKKRTEKNEKLAERLAGILIELNTCGQVDIKELAERFKVSERTLQKDLNIRLAFLEWEKPAHVIIPLIKINWVFLLN